MYIFIYLGYIPRNGNDESYGNFMFNCLRHWQTFFQGRCIILHFHQQCRVLISPYRHQDSLCYLCVTAILVGWRSTSLWFRFAFPSWLRLVSIFPWTDWSFAVLLWRKTYSNLSPIFNKPVCPFVVELYRYTLLFCLFSWSVCLHIGDRLPTRLRAGDH